jgi:glycosyltransferase involved in cell wall biosynthesis
MHVVHVTPYFAPAFVYGGPARSVLGLCRGLQQAGVDVEVITTSANGAVDFPASPPSGDVYDEVRVHYARRRFPRRFFAAAIRKPLMEALERADLCHIHGVLNFTAWEAARCAERQGVPLMVSPRGMLLPAAFDHHKWRKRIAYQVFDRRLLSGAVRVHATSVEEAAALEHVVDPNRVITIPNGVDIDEVTAAPVPNQVRTRLGIPAGPLVLFLGRLHPIKRLDLLAGAVARVREVSPSVNLVLAGPNENNHLAALASHLAPLGGAVRSVGPVHDADKWALLREAAVLVNCSDSESFGMSVVEAMAAGRPVVVTQTCPWSEVARERAGCWVPQDIQSIADAILSILRNTSVADAMGAAGARLVAARYGWRAIGETMARCYTDVVSAERSAA